jgi:hypothetical protein
MPGFKLPIPELLYPYSTIARPMPPPPIQNVCEGDLTCVRFSCSLIPYLLGLLEVYRYKDSFTGTDEEKTIAVGVMRQLMEVLAMSGCGCDDNITQVIKHRINPTTGDQEISIDDGATWTSDPQSVYNQATQAAPLHGADSTVKQCEAANNVVANLKDVQARWSSYIGVLNSITELLATMVVDVLAMLFLPVVGAELVALGSPITMKIFEAAQILLGTTQEAYDLLFTENNWTLLRCILYCNGHEDGTFNAGDYVNIISQVRAQLTVPSPNAGDSIACMIDSWGLIGLNNAARIGAGEEGNCDDCDCPPRSCASADNFYWGTVNSTTDNMDGTVTFNVTSAPGIDGTEFVGWGDRDNPGSPCCTFVGQSAFVGTALGGAYQSCGSSDEIPDPPAPNYCIHFYLFYGNLSLTTPFTCDIVMGSDCP